MDDFLVALIAVFVILGVLMAASVYVPYYPEGTEEEMNTVHTFSPATTIGYTENYVSRVQEFGSMKVGVPEAYELKTLPKMEITAGLFGGTSEEFEISVPDYVADWVKGGTITFTVTDTNKYNNLVIEWNGAKIYDDKAYEGDHEVTILPEQIKEQNTLEVRALGPGLAFWAATAYSLREFTVNAEYGPAKFMDFDVSDDELEALDMFELLWYTAKSRGELAVEVNGEELYRAEPERDAKITFMDTDLEEVTIRPGKNRLIFKAYDGSFELDDVILNTHVSMAQKVLREKFELTDEQLEALGDNIVLKLRIGSVDKSGTINTKLNDVRSGSGTGKAGLVSIPMSTSSLTSGGNWLEISSLGAFEITDASIEVAS